jgi:pimeloyl-ACP methyl ester carboxylesterase
MRKDYYVCWSHGQESGPWGAKITALVEAARQKGFEATSLDYRGMVDPEDRVEKLIAHGRTVTKPLILAGSSIGGYVAAAAARTLKPAGLFLLAPAFYLPVCQTREFAGVPERTAIVHGWGDDVIPPENSFKFAQIHRATLHLVDGDHRLLGNVAEIKAYYLSFLDAFQNPND